MTGSSHGSSRWTVGDPSTPLALRLFANLYVGIFGRRRFYRWNQRLLNLAVRGLGVGNPTEGMVMEHEERFIRSLGSLGSIDVFDVGAHVGEFAVRLRESCPDARIWSFEPHPESFKKLARAVEGLNVTAVNLGLSDEAGRVELFDYEEAGGSGTAHASLHSGVFQGIHHGRAVALEVEVTTLDDFLEARGIARLTFLKVDAEGHELAVLRGAAKAIAAGRLDVVQFEFNEMNVMSRVFFKDFYDALPGFSFYRMAVDGLAPMGPYQPRTHELFILQNVVAIRDGFEGRRALL